MPASITISNDALQISLGQLGAAVADRDGALKVAGELMRASVTQTFRDEGSPAGSWPQLAASTRKKKGYSAGHKLLILSGRLFNSISYVVSNGQLTIGTNLVYAPVHQLGSKDRAGGSIGPQAKIVGREVKVSAFSFMRVLQKESRAKGKEQRRIRVQQKVATHTRHQNMPARPFLVFRPEDPARIVSGIEAYLQQKSPAVAK